MSVFVTHPDAWIGIPSEWPFDRWPTVAAWADDLIAELVAQGRLSSADAAAHAETVRLVASTRAERGASRSFLAFAGGDAYLADLVLEARSEFDVRELAALAGANDPTSIENPIVRSIHNVDGVEGVRVTRYLDLADGTSAVVARTDYVFAVGSEVARLYTANYDLVVFERMRQLLDDLARTVTFR